MHVTAPLQRLTAICKETMQIQMTVLLRRLDVRAAARSRVLAIRAQNVLTNMPHGASTIAPGGKNSRLTSALSDSGALRFRGFQNLGRRHPLIEPADDGRFAIYSHCEVQVLATKRVCAPPERWDDRLDDRMKNVHSTRHGLDSLSFAESDHISRRRSLAPKRSGLRRRGQIRTNMRRKELNRACESALRPAPALAPEAKPNERPRFAILVALSVTHGLNDLVQSLIAASYPVLKASFALDFKRIGLITLAFQATASLLQPFVGLYTDRKSVPYSLAAGMSVTLGGLLLLSFANTFVELLAAASMIGIGSSVFHPEASRIARAAAGVRHGLAQSIFQVGGNAGAAAGPLLAAFIVAPRGQQSLAFMAFFPVAGIAILVAIGRWHIGYVGRMTAARRGAPTAPDLPRKTVARSFLILLALIFSKFVYIAALTNYYTFYLIDAFHVPLQTAQVFLFFFLGANAVGTFAGGPIGDRIGRRRVILGSILGVLPFTLLLPQANLFFTGVLSAIIGLILSSAFSAILVYASELRPGKIGTVAGLFFGFAFGVAGLGAAALGALADMTSIEFVYRVCAFLPAIGLLAFFLPRLEPLDRA
jgi:FSR family fosmidomycin resistance protein-like MFS transporter